VEPLAELSIQEKLSQQGYGENTGREMAESLTQVRAAKFCAPAKDLAFLFCVLV